jgi:hypothetical protein
MFTSNRVKYEYVEVVLSNFDFDGLRKYMCKHDIRWSYNGVMSVPSTFELINTARSLLYKVVESDGKYSTCGRHSFVATRIGKELRLDYVAFSGRVYMSGKEDSDGKEG